MPNHSFADYINAELQAPRLPLLGNSPRTQAEAQERDKALASGSPTKSLKKSPTKNEFNSLKRHLISAQDFSTHVDVAAYSPYTQAEFTVIRLYTDYLDWVAKQTEKSDTEPTTTVAELLEQLCITTAYYVHTLKEMKQNADPLLRAVPKDMVRIGAIQVEDRLGTAFFEHQRKEIFQVFNIFNQFNKRRLSGTSVVLLGLIAALTYICVEARAIQNATGSATLIFMASLTAMAICTAVWSRYLQGNPSSKDTQKCYTKAMAKPGHHDTLNKKLNVMVTEGIKELPKQVVGEVAQLVSATTDCWLISARFDKKSGKPVQTIDDAIVIPQLQHRIAAR